MDEKLGKDIIEIPEIKEIIEGTEDNFSIDEVGEIAWGVEKNHRIAQIYGD